MSAAGVGDPGAGAIWGETFEGVDAEVLRQVVEPMLIPRSGNPASDRKRMLEFLWRETPKSNRSGRGAKRMVMVRGAGGSALAPLDSLTDEEIETALGLKAGESRVGNPAAEAAAKYAEFHGRAPRETLEIHEEVHTHSHLAALGALTRIKVNCESGVKATIDFSAGDAEDERPILATSEDGRQLYIRGGDQSLDLSAIGMDGSEWTRDSMCIGEVTDVEYQTAKGFDNFDLVTYFHKLGEESKVRPYLVYDTVNQLLSIVGGQYEVKPEGIVN